MINTLLTEILGFLLGASVLGLLVGWMIKSTVAKRQLQRTDAEWSQKFSELELRSSQDSDNLEEQIQTLGSEIKTLTASNRALGDSLRKNEVSVHKARTDAIELNRQQAETQERLQRIIQERDEEIVALKSQGNQAQEVTQAAAKAGAASAVAAQVMQLRTDRVAGNDDHAGDIQARIDSLDSKRESLEQERQQLLDNTDEEQQTVAIDQSDLPLESLDQTVRLDPAALPGGSATLLEDIEDTLEEPVSAGDFSADATAILDDGIEMDEATVALDPDSLPFSDGQDDPAAGDGSGGIPNGDDQATRLVRPRKPGSDSSPS